MTADADALRWQRLSALFDRAIDLDVAARHALVDAECAHDPALRDALDRMLAADDVALAGALDAGAAALVDARMVAAVPLPLTGARDIDADDGEAAIGERLGHWRLLRVLGRGGMGTVFAARREETGDAHEDVRVTAQADDPASTDRHGARDDATRDSRQRAAIKRLHRRWDGSLQAQRFLQERRILAALSHPHIPQLVDHGVDRDGRPWFALELIEGQPIDAWADAQRLGMEARVALFRDVCAAVQHAHEHFVVHRDLKPSNVLVSAAGHAKVLDFGVAKRLDTGRLDGGRRDATAGERERADTRTGMFVGFTPEYAAPEQVSGGAITAATDVYALGVMLFQLLTGHLPYAVDVDDLHATTATIISRAPGRLDQAITTGAPGDIAARLRHRDTDLRGFRRFVRGDLSRIVQTALAKEPPRRYASVQALSDDLRRLLQGRPVSVSGDTLAYRARKFAQRNRWSVAMASLAVIALLGGSIGVAWQAERARREAQTAVQVKDYLIDMFRQADVQANAGTRDAQRMLDDAASRLDLLPPDSRVRNEVLTVLLGLYDSRGFREAGRRLAQRELPGVPTWRGDDADPARLRALLMALRLRDAGGDSGAARIALLDAALARYPHPRAVEMGEAMTLRGEFDGDADRPAKAARWHARALSILRDTLPAADDRVTYSTVLLAGALTTERKVREGRALSERALADTPATSSWRAYVCTMAALRRAALGEFAAAAPLFEESRRIQQREGMWRLSEYFVTTRVTNLLALGDLARADADIDAGIAGQRARSGGPMPGALVPLLWLRGEVALADGDSARAADAFAEASRQQAGGAGDDVDGDYVAALHAVSLAQAGRVADARVVLSGSPRPAAGPASRVQAMTYATAMRLGARGVVAMHDGDPAAGVAHLRAALAALDAARRQPLDVHGQLRETRDAVRLRTWLAQAQHAAGDDAAAAATITEAHALGLRTLGPQHPFVQQVARAQADLSTARSAQRPIWPASTAARRPRHRRHVAPAIAAPAPASTHTSTGRTVRTS